jgi:hypothetical protein
MHAHIMDERGLTVFTTERNLSIVQTLPTAEKNSSKSRGRIRAASCMQNTVRASRSSGVSSGDGVLQQKHNKTHATQYNNSFALDSRMKCNFA